MAHIKPILIDAKNRAVKIMPEAEYSLDQIRTAIGCQWITMAALPSGDEIVLDDEGLINGQENYFWFEGCNQPFAGNGLVVGPPDDDGDSTNPTITAFEIASKVKFSPREALKQEYLEQLCEPQFLSFNSDEEMLEFLKTGKVKS